MNDIFREHHWEPIQPALAAWPLGSRAMSFFASANGAEGYCCRSNSLGADYGGRGGTRTPGTRGTLLAKQRGKTLTCFDVA